MMTSNHLKKSEFMIKEYRFTKDPKQALQLQIGYRSGNVVIPNIPLEEGLYGMAGEFIRAISKNKKPVTDGEHGTSGSQVYQCGNKIPPK